MTKVTRARPTAGHNPIRKVARWQKRGPEREPQLEKLARLVQSLEIVLWPIARPQVNPRNPRAHGDKQLALLAASIRQFGFTAPILVDEKGMVLAGHGRLKAAQSLGLTKVPVVSVTHLTAADKRALQIADNQIAALAGWDHDLLRVELAELNMPDLGFEVEITGFDTAEIDRIMQVGNDAAEDDPADTILPLADDGPAITRYYVALATASLLDR